MSGYTHCKDLQKLMAQGSSESLKVFELEESNGVMWIQMIVPFNTQVNNQQPKSDKATETIHKELKTSGETNTCR